MQDAWYDVAQICMNGHLINHSTKNHPQHNREFCNKCGKATITICPKCDGEIQGAYYTKSEYGISRSDLGTEWIRSGLSFCSHCGEPYPWTEAKIQAAHDLAQELENISEEEKRILSESIDDLVKDTPRTELAATRFKKIVSKIGKPVGETLRDLIVDIASETAKKMLLP